MKYRSPFLLVFAVTAVLSPLTIRAIDRAAVEIEHRSNVFMALQIRDADQCDMPVPLAMDVPGGCIRVSRTAFNGIGTLTPLLIASMN